MSIRKKVANLWAPLLQSKGNSTTQPMSQKAVSDELSQLKSDLDGKINYTDSLTYEEIMATNIDLTNKVAKAESVKTIANKFDGKIIFAGYFSNIDKLKEWIVQNKPSTPWIAYWNSPSFSTALGSHFNTYLNGFVSFIVVSSVDSNILFYNFNNGTWNK